MAIYYWFPLSPVTSPSVSLLFGRWVTQYSLMANGKPASEFLWLHAGGAVWRVTREIQRFLPLVPVGRGEWHGSSCCLSEKPPTQIWTLNPELLIFPLCVCICVGDSRSTVLHFWKNELLALKLHCVTFLSHQVFSFFCLRKIGVYIMLKCKWSAWGLLFPPSSLSLCLLLCK